MIKTLRNLLKQDKERFVVPRGVQDVIPIKAIYDDGIFQVGRDKFSKTYKFSDINYAVASREDKEAIFSNTVMALSAVSDFFSLAASDNTPLLHGTLQIVPQQRLVYQKGVRIELTPMEFDILLLLARRPGQVFSSRQIYEAVAADSFDASWTGISSMVYKLRRKLGADIIETVRGHGYRMKITK